MQFSISLCEHWTFTKSNWNTVIEMNADCGSTGQLNENDYTENGSWKYVKKNYTKNNCKRLNYTADSLLDYFHMYVIERWTNCFHLILASNSFNFERCISSSIGLNYSAKSSQQKHPNSNMLQRKMKSTGIGQHNSQRLK